MSPESVRRDLEEKRTERQQVKMGKWNQKLDERRHQREREMLDEVLREIQESQTTGMLHKYISSDSC
jgi:hypothetical protein